MSDDDLWDRITSKIGQPRPCDLCQALTPVKDLEEHTVPGTVVFDAFGDPEWTLTVRRVVWLCPDCPR